MSRSIPPLPLEAEDQAHTLANALTPPIGQGRILVVDDEPGVLTTIQAILKMEGYDVRGAASGHDALNILREQAFDLILTDLRLGSDDGLEMLAELRKLAPDTVAIVLTGYASLESAIEAMRQGAYDYLVKPTDVEELKLTVARALERQRLQRELAERVGELESANQKIQRFNSDLRRQVGAATEALQQKIDELAQAKAALEDAQQQQNLFLAMVAHELMNPATAIIGYAQYAGQPNQKPERITGSIGSIVSQGERLKRLIRDLQDISRLATGQFELQRTSCDLFALVSDTIEQFRSTHTSHHFTLITQEDASNLQGSYDRDRIIQAFGNLLDNAVKYSDSDTMVTVRLWTDEGWDCLSVHDEGMGIAPEAQAHLFKPFGRLEPARSRKIKGSGLGLYITKGIIEAHDGQLLIESGEGTTTGATFTLKFQHAR
ncbi:MAG TPA: response regulator [Ktedonobacterales bacterium]|jgi:signal transduction histidine kinase